MDKEITFDNFNRMQYHPDFHENQGKPFTVSDLEYLCKFWGFDETRTMAFAIGRTETTIASKVSSLRKSGLFDYYKNLNKYWG